ncbi:MAG: helix-turn-helix transcriptional regulator [Herminiimonas sp.]|nr:helix-turn-helix transcriptional regulator [Herminiimonas sp.]
MSDLPLLPDVFNALTLSNASLVKAAPLHDGFTAALWHRSHLEDTTYQRPDHHTLSLYLDGGFDVSRRDRPGLHGAPDKICLLPAEHVSDWRIDGTIRFLHLYFTPAQFDHLAVTLLDREPRDLVLRDQTYIDDPQLVIAGRRLATLDWCDPNAQLAGNAISHEIIAHLMLNYSSRKTAVRVTGGLSAAHRRRARELIEAGLDQELSLAAMAAQLELSEFHFARMFRVSFGLPPHAWITLRRIDRARHLLAQGALGLADVAAACGFGSASHLANRFRAYTGVTPGRYRAWASA